MTLSLGTNAVALGGIVAHRWRLSVGLAVVKCHWLVWRLAHPVSFGPVAGFGGGDSTPNQTEKLLFRQPTISSASLLFLLR